MSQSQQRLQTCPTCHHQTAKVEQDPRGNRERLVCTAKGCSVKGVWKATPKNGKH